MCLQARSETVDLNTDTSLVVDISDALSEKDKVKFTVHTKVSHNSDTEYTIICWFIAIWGLWDPGLWLLRIKKACAEAIIIAKLHKWTDNHFPKKTSKNIIYQF